MSTLFSQIGCQTISLLVDSIVNDLLLEFVPDGKQTMPKHSWRAMWRNYDVITDEEPQNK